MEVKYNHVGHVFVARTS